MFLVTDDLVKSERCLHTPSVFAKQNLLYVQEVGYSESKQPHRCIRENINSFLFMLVMEGEGYIDVEEKHYEMGKGDCCFINCMNHFEHISSDTNAWKLAWIHFNGTIALSYYELFVNNTLHNVFHINDMENWKIYVEKLIVAQKDRSLSSELISGELLLSLLNKIVISVLDSKEKDKEIASKIRVYINDNYNRQDIMEMIEKILEQNIGVLNEVFRRYYGIDIKDYTEKRRFNMAKQLLRFSVKPIDEILIESGINNYSNMQDQFMKEEGMTAEQYRQRWAQWIRQ